MEQLIQPVSEITVKSEFLHQVFSTVNTLP